MKSEKKTGKDDKDLSNSRRRVDDKNPQPYNRKHKRKKKRILKVDFKRTDEMPEKYKDDAIFMVSFWRRDWVWSSCGKYEKMKDAMNAVKATKQFTSDQRIEWEWRIVDIETGEIIKTGIQKVRS